MKLYSQLEEAQIENLATDPTNLTEGRIWKNTTTNQVKVYKDGSVQIVTFKAELDSAISTLETATALALANHESDTTNIHGITDTSALLTDANTKTMTNKTYDAEGTGNSLSNIKNANIKVGAAIDLTKLATVTASKALVSNSSGVITPSTVSDIELSYLAGVTSAIQTQIDAIVSASGFSTGDVKFTLKNTADSGWIMCNDGTIGSATSGATTRAHADTSALYTLLWNNVSNTYAAVTGGRGASAAADFAANKPIALTRMLGRVLAVAGSGVGLTARSMGQTLGEETHVLSIAEMPSHNHGGGSHTHTVPGVYGGDFPDGGYVGPGTQGGGGVSNFFSVTTGSSGPIISSQGSDTAHNNMQPTSFLNAMIKL